MGENVVDVAHFKYLHGMTQLPPAVIDLREHVFHMETPTFMHGRGGEVSGTLESNSYGFGISTNRFTGFVETLVIGNVTAADDEFVDIRFSFLIKNSGDADITKGIGKAFAAEIARQLEQGIPVWENKVYFEKPVLCDSDGPLMKDRHRAKQFFPSWYRKRAREMWQAERDARPETRPPSAAEYDEAKARCESQKEAPDDARGVLRSLTSRAATHVIPSGTRHEYYTYRNSAYGLLRRSPMTAFGTLST
jgi:hypothetical protein